MTVLANVPLPVLKVAPFIIKKDGKIYPLTSLSVVNDVQTPTYSPDGYACLLLASNDGKLIVQANGVDALSVGTVNVTGVSVANLLSDGLTLSADNHIIAMTQKGQTSSIKLVDALSATAVNGKTYSVTDTGITVGTGSNLLELLNIVAGSLAANGTDGSLTITRVDGAVTLSIVPTSNGIVIDNPGKGSLVTASDGKRFNVTLNRVVDGHLHSSMIVANGADIVTQTNIDGVRTHSTRITYDGRLVIDESDSNPANWSMVQPIALDEDALRCLVHNVNGSLVEVKLPRADYHPCNPGGLWSGGANSGVATLSSAVSNFKFIRLAYDIGGGATSVKVPVADCTGDLYVGGGASDPSYSKTVPTGYVDHYHLRFDSPSSITFTPIMGGGGSVNNNTFTGVSGECS